HFFGFVGPKRDGELMFGFEFVLGAYGVGRNPKNRGAGLGKFATQPREGDCLLGAAWCVGLGVKIEDEVAAFEVPQRDFAAAIPREREGRGLRTRNKLLRHVPSFRRFRGLMSHMPFASGGRNGFHRYGPYAAPPGGQAAGAIHILRRTRGAT